MNVIFLIIANSCVLAMKSEREVIVNQMIFNLNLITFKKDLVPKFLF